MWRYKCDTCGRVLVSNIELTGRDAICNKVTKERQKGGRLRRVPCRGRFVLMDFVDASTNYSHHESVDVELSSS